MIAATTNTEGQIVTTIDYEAAAQEHRPASRAELAEAARQLSAQGLTARDIGQCLQLSEAAIVELLADSPNEGRI